MYLKLLENVMKKEGVRCLHMVHPVKVVPMVRDPQRVRTQVLAMWDSAFACFLYLGRTPVTCAQTWSQERDAGIFQAVSLPAQWSDCYCDRNGSIRFN